MEEENVKKSKIQLTEKQKKYLTIKRKIDMVLSGGAIILLSPVMAGIAVAIKLDSPGPVLFKQKRVGKDKELFEIWKFRTMRTDTPKDMPTHMLGNADAYITKIGKFLRKTSLDELPQIFNIFSGKMSIIGPRPALWNQEDLILERDKYGANDVTPGLTGWAQINGRDELEIPIKAEFDGAYVKNMGLKMDIKCFLGTIGSVLTHDGVVEGGTGELNKQNPEKSAVIEPKKIEQEIKMGIAVVGVAAAIASGCLYGIYCYYKNRHEGAEKKKKSHIKGMIGTGAVISAAAFIRQKNMQNKWNVKSKNTDKVVPKRILFLSNHFITLFSFRKELINRLLQEGHEIYISMPEDPDNAYFEELGCKMIPTPVDRRGVNPKNDIGTIRAYFKIMKDVQPDIVFSYTIKPNVYGTFVSNLLGYKQVCNVTGTGATFLEDTLVSKIATQLYRMTVKHGYKAFFQNSGDRDLFIKKKMIKDNWEMLPGSGVNLEQYQVTDLPGEEEINFIFIGRVMKLKGIEEFLDAAKSVKEKYGNVHFYIAGWNEEEEYIEKVQKYEQEGYVNYIGFQKNISEWIQRCHCTILPSHGGEGVPNVLLETAASGRVCIASDINGSRDVVEDGVTGYIFETGNAESLAEKIEQFIQLSYEEKKNMGLSGRRKVEAEFDREIVIQKYLNEVHQTVKRKSN